jgi:hypothetical protein
VRRSKLTLLLDLDDLGTDVNKDILDNFNLLKTE